jgi:hypothetical protein
MWQPIRDCGKQLTLNSRLREKQGDDYKYYTIVEVEFDQYHLQLRNENNEPVQDLRQIFSCTQLVEHRFDLEA